MDILDKFQMEMLVNDIAEQMMVYFNALIKAGFTEEQAFELVKEHGISVGRII